MDNFKAQKFKVLDKKINVAVGGQGKDLILIHGWSNSWVGWTLLADRLIKSYRVWMIDLPGFGDSDALDEYTIGIESKYIAAFIKNQKLKPAAIIGASMGTIISANTLKDYPDIASKLIMLGAVFKDLSPKQKAKLLNRLLKIARRYHFVEVTFVGIVKSRLTAYAVEKFLNAYKFDREKVDKYSLPGRKKITSKSYVHLGLSAVEFNLENFLKGLKKPTLIIYGEKERYVKPEHAREILAEIGNPAIKMVVVDRSGHNPAYEQPEQTAKIIEKFIG